MKSLLFFFVSMIATSLSGQFVSTNIGSTNQVIANMHPLYIGAGLSGNCGSAYVSGVTETSQLIWEKYMNDLPNGFISDIFKIDSLNFYVCGLNWVSDDVPELESIFLIKMDVSGNVLFQMKFTDTTYLNLINGNPNVHIELNSDGEVFLSKDRLFLKTNSDGQLIEWFTVNEPARDFKINDQDQIIYLSQKAIHIKDPINPEFILKSGFNNLNSVELNDEQIYILDGSANLFKTNLQGSILENLSAGLGISNINDFSILKNKIYMIGLNSKGINHLFIITDSIVRTNTNISLGSLSGVDLYHIDVNQDRLLISGRSNYGINKSFYLTLQHDYKVPVLNENLKLSNYRQTTVRAVPKDSFQNIVIYEYFFGFEYDITNVSASTPVYDFEVFSNVYDGFGCFAFFYYYHFDKDTLYPQQTIKLNGNGSIYRVSSLKYNLCLSVVAPNQTLDANSNDNYLCQTLVNNINPEVESDIQLYPNPVSNIIHVESNSQVSIIIYNTVGTKISTLHNVSSQDLDLSKYPSGIYYFSLIGIDGLRTVKIIEKI